YPNEHARLSFKDRLHAKKSKLVLTVRNNSSAAIALNNSFSPIDAFRTLCISIVIFLADNFLLSKGRIHLSNRIEIDIDTIKMSYSIRVTKEVIYHNAIAMLSVSAREFNANAAIGQRYGLPRCKVDLRSRTRSGRRNCRL